MQNVAISFADGVVWVDLATLADPALVPGTLASILSVTHTSEISLAGGDAPVRDMAELGYP